MAKRRKCKTCGRSFVPQGPDEHYCSSLCRTAGCFVGGGGDTRKPLSPEQRKALEKKGIDPSSKSPDEPPKRERKPAAKYPRVLAMFELPLERRAELSSKFTPEEEEYARRLARKMLLEERRIDDEISMDGGDDSGCLVDMAGGSLGESDDGTI